MRLLLRHRSGDSPFALEYPSFLKAQTSCGRTWMQRKALSFLDLKVGMRFLDLGCGTGYAVRHVAAWAQHDGFFCGTDISLLKSLKRSQAARFAVADSEALPLGTDFFDDVLCTNYFHHYGYPLEALAEIRRMLRLGSRLCILDVTADSRLVRWIA